MDSNNAITDEISSFGDARLIEVISKDVDQNSQILNTSDLKRRGENGQKDVSKAQETQQKLEPKTKKDQTIVAKNKKAKVSESLEEKPI